MSGNVPIRTAFITGAASGIGLGITQHLLSLSHVTWRVIIGDLNEEDGKKAAFDLASEHGHDRVTFIKIDTSSWEGNTEAFKQAWEWSNHRIDVFAPNAGIAMRTNLFNVSPDEELTQPSLKTIDVNLVGPLYGTKCFLYYARKTRKTLQGTSDSGNDHTLAYNGKLIFTASMLGLYGSKNTPIYSATKHAIIGITRSIAPGLAATDGIYVNALAPGWVDTKIFPDEIKKLCPAEYKTPMSTITRAFDELIAGVEYEGMNVERRGIFGHILETSGESLYHRDMVPYPDEITKSIQTMFSSSPGTGNA